MRGGCKNSFDSFRLEECSQVVSGWGQWGHLESGGIPVGVIDLRYMDPSSLTSVIARSLREGLFRAVSAGIVSFWTLFSKELVGHSFTE